MNRTAAYGNSTAVDNLKMLYENDEVAVVYDNANNSDKDRIAMIFRPKMDGKFSVWTVVRQVV